MRIRRHVADVELADARVVERDVVGETVARLDLERLAFVDREQFAEWDLLEAWEHLEFVVVRLCALPCECDWEQLAVFDLELFDLLVGYNISISLSIITFHLYIL